MRSRGTGEGAGRVIEPRKVYNRGRQDRSCGCIAGLNADGVDALEGGRLAADCRWLGRPSPPGSESGACAHKGGSGTRESLLSPCGTRRKIRGTGLSRAPASTASGPAIDELRETEGHKPLSARKVSRPGAKANRPRRAEAVLAEHSTDEGGEPTPKGPTGGKATPGMTFCWRELWEILRDHKPYPRNSSGLLSGRRSTLIWCSRRWLT